MSDEDLFAEIDLILAKANTSEVVDVTKLEIPELLDMVSDITDELFEAGEAIWPKTQWARDKHSLRNAIQVEIRRKAGGNG